MKTLIVYDSFFGNTEQIALAIRDSLDSKENIGACRISDLKPEQFDGVTFLIVGSPTRQFNPTKAITDFLNRIPLNGLQGVKVLAFDTRIAPADANSRVYNIMAKLFGYAAKPIADKLVEKGGALILPPEGFIVRDTKGPLKDGELERAADWAKFQMNYKKEGD